jgi:hypothetical protein
VNKLPNRLKTVIFLTFCLVIITLPVQSQATNRTSVGLVGGFGLPVGWWGDRWDAIQSGELNFRYEFSPGVGILLITGLNKTYFTPLSKEEVAAESHYSDVMLEYKPYTTIVKGSQGGSLKQLPVGVGVYMERMVWRVRPYGSLAMIVYNWRFERSQEFLGEISPPDMPVIDLNDDSWNLSRDGSDLGAQIVLGTVYDLTKLFHVDVSAAYHFVSISPKYGSIAYWGQPAVIPAGQPDNDLVKDSKGTVNFLQFRIGLRVGG